MIKEDVLEDSTGITRWLTQTAAELADFEELDAEDKACFFRYFGEEMLEYSESIGFRCEQLDEFVSPEEEEEQV